MIAPWRRKLLAGAFRGVPFKFRQHDTVLGRRTETHEYPGRDEPYVEDLGAAAREFSLDVFIIGPDYMAGRDALVNALNQPGPGDLDHPYLGTRRVMVTDARLTESADEGGMARFAITFTATAEPLRATGAKPDTAGQVATAAEAAGEAAEQSFGTRALDWLQAGADYVGQAAGLLSGGLVSAVLQYARRWLPVGELLGGVAGLYRLGIALVGLRSDPLGWSRGFRQLFGNFGGLARSLFTDEAGQARKAGQLQAARALRGVGGWGESLTPGTAGALVRIGQATAYTGTATQAARAVQDAIRGGESVVIPSIQIHAGAGSEVSPSTALLIALVAELAALVRRLALIEEARLAADMRFDSTGEALDFRNDLAERLQAEAETADDATAEELLNLRRAVIVDLTARAADLRRYAAYTLAATLPAAVLAQRLYGTPRPAADIVARNRIPHPAFVPGGQPLEILSP